MTIMNVAKHLILHRINQQLPGKILLRSDSVKNKDLVCLIIDDSDLPRVLDALISRERNIQHYVNFDRLGITKAA